MNKYFVDKWEKNKGVLESFLRDNLQPDEWNDYNINYKFLMNLVIHTIYNYGADYWDEFSDCLKIDDGEHQGTLIFIFHKNVYQPCLDEYYYSAVNYGSCSVCDTLQRVLFDNRDNFEGLIKDLMTLCLHLVQNTDLLGKENDE